MGVARLSDDQALISAIVLCQVSYTDQVHSSNRWAKPPITQGPWCEAQTMPRALRLNAPPVWLEALGASRLLKNSFAFGDEAGVIAVVDEDVPDEPPGGA